MVPTVATRGLNWSAGRAAHPEQNAYLTRCPACLASLASVTKETRESIGYARHHGKGSNRTTAPARLAPVQHRHLVDRSGRSAAGLYAAGPARGHQRARAAAAAATRPGGRARRPQPAAAPAPRRRAKPAAAAKVQPKGSITMVIEAEPDTILHQGRHHRQRQFRDGQRLRPVDRPRLVQRHAEDRRRAGRELQPESDRPEDLALQAAPGPQVHQR